MALELFFDVLRAIAFRPAGNGLAFHVNMRKWVAEYIKGEVKPPTRSRHVKAENLYRDLLISGAIHELME